MEVKVCASPATAVRQYHHSHRRAALPEIQSAISVGRRDILRVAAGQGRKKMNSA